MDPRACPSKEQLADYLVGRGDAERLDEWARHLDACAACQRRADECDDRGDPLLTALRDTSGTADGPIEPLLASLIDKAKASAAAPLEPRSIGDYELLKKLGEGGFGVVYLARSRYLDRLAAVKLLTNPHPATKARFLREMQAIGRFPAHANVVSAWQASEEEGVLYLVMEYVEGIDVARLLRRSGPLAIADACEIARQTAAALAHIDRHQLVHRDLKPANLMLARNGIVKLLDLGLASLSGEEFSRERPTESGMLLGTFDYIAPEQADDPRQADIRADLYSLGCTLHALLAGRPPFFGESRLAKLEAHRRHDPPPLRTLRADVPADVEALVLRLLAKRPEDRVQTPGAVADELTPFCKGAALEALVQVEDVERIHAQPRDQRHGTTTRTYQPATARWRLVVPALLVAALLLAFGFWLGYRPSGPAQGSASAVLAAEFAPGDEPGWALTLTPDGQRAFGVSADRKRVYAIDLHGKTPARTWTHGGAALPHTNLVHLHREGRIVLGIHEQPNHAGLKLYDVPSGDILAERALTLATLSAIAVSSDGQWLAAAETGGRIQLFDAPTLKPAGQSFNIGTTATCLVFDHDARHLWSAGADGVLRGHTRDGKEVKAWPAHEAKQGEHEAISALTITGDGRLLLTGSLGEQLLRRWTLPDGDKAGAAPVKHGTSALSCVAFAADGKRAVTGHVGGEVLVWDLDQAAVIAKYDRHRGPVAAVAVTPDAARAISAGMEDRTLWVYAIAKN